MTNRRWLLLFALASVTLGICLLLLTDWLPYLRGPVWLEGAWRWPYLVRPLVRWWLPLTSALFALVISAWWLKAPNKRRNLTLLGLTGLTASSLLLQGSLLFADRPQVAAELVDRTLALQTSGYYRTAAEIDDIRHVLEDYPSAMRQFESEHARTHPPGLILGNKLLIEGMEKMPKVSERLADILRPLRCTDLWILESDQATLAGLAISSLLAPLAAALAIPVAYACARQITGEYGSRLAAIFTATLPALLLFAPLADQILALMSLFGLLLLFLAWRRRSLLLYFAAGVAFSVASFTSLGTLGLIVVPAVLLAAQFLQTPEYRRAVVAWAGAFLLGLVSVWLACWILWGVAPFDVAQTALNQHYELVTSQRAYGLWFAFNLVDLILFSGPVIVFGLVGAIAHAFAQFRTRPLEGPETVSLSVLALIAVLLVSGTTRGEVGRIWLFFMPLMAISSGAYLAGWLPDWKAAVLIVGLQLALAVSLGLAWRPVEAVIVRAERPAMAEVPTQVVDVEIGYEDGIELTGYSVPAAAISHGEELSITLIWRSEGPTRRPYTTFVHLVDGAGRIVAQSDSWPVNRQWPPTCWQEGESVIDSVMIPLPAEMGAGEYLVRVGLYDAQNGTRLLTDDGFDAYPLIPVLIDGNGYE